MLTRNFFTKRTQRQFLTTAIDLLQKKEDMNLYPATSEPAQPVPTLTLTSAGRLEMRVPGARTGGGGGGLTAPSPGVATAFEDAWRAVM